MDTIVALATPVGNSGVAVVRVSGDNSLNLLKQITKESANYEPRKMYLKNVYVDDLVDKCLVVYFRAPMSYTGEDVVEVQSHGGYLISKKIIEKFITLGARLASKGEFSKRAFISGKLSLDQAEGIIDLINAESDLQAKSGSDLLMGRLTNQIKTIQDNILDILADIEAKLDYPEYDFLDSEEEKTKASLIRIKQDLSNLLSTSKSGQIIRSGVNVAIVGEPNVGKSSLLNALTNTDKSIVTSVAGTTRDVVEAEYEYKGIIFRLYDTAGIHESNDEVERIGIDRARKILDTSDIVLRITTPNVPIRIETNKPNILVINKSDTTKDLDNNLFYVSAVTGHNIEVLKQKIFDLCVGENLSIDRLYLTNVRHIECVTRAVSSIDLAISSLDNSTLDIVASLIKDSWLALGEITGTESNEDILDRVFSKFCLGK